MRSPEKAVTPGLWADRQRLILATQNQLIRFENVLAPNQLMVIYED